MTKQLYNVGLTETVQRDENITRSAQLAETGALTRDTTDVEQTIADAPDVRLRGVLHPEAYARPDLVADELRELGDSAVGAIPLFRPGASYKDSGFFEVQETIVNPARPVERRVWQYDARLSRAGGRSASFRSVATNTTTVSHPFGFDSDADLALPESARAVRWYNPDDQTSTVATASGTVGSAQGTLEQYPLSDAPDSDTEHLVYDIAYADDAVGCRVYDTRTNTDKLDSNGIRQWQTVFDTTHDITPDSPVVLSNGRTRLRVILQTSGVGSVQTADWSGGSWGSWSDITPSDYEPVDLDVISIDQQRVAAQLLFESDTGGSTYAVNIQLTLGYADPLIYAAPGEGSSIPTNIESALSGTARTSEKRTQATRTLVEREAVRR